MSRKTKTEIAEDKLKLKKIENALRVEEIKSRALATVDGAVTYRGGSPYDAASTSSVVGREWDAFTGDADDELNGIQRMRERSRDLYRNNPIGGGAIKTKASSVIGSGLRLQCTINPKLVGLSPEQAREKENLIERYWEMWSKECDASCQADMSELQDQAYRSMLVSGDSFTMLPLIERKGSPFLLRIKVLDGDKVSNPNFTLDTPSCRAGVQIGQHDEAAGYHFRFRREMYRDEWKYVPAYGEKSGRRNVIHLMRQDRPGARRGMPMLTIMASLLKQVGRYMDAETMAAVVSSFWTGFIESNNDDALNSTLTQIFQDAGQDAGAIPQYDVTPGSIHHLRAGEKISFPAHGRPNTSFGPFMQTLMEFAGMGLEMPYEILMRHYSSSYSASRGARIDWEKVAKIDRSWFNRKWNQEIYETFLWHMVVMGVIDLPGFLEDRFTREAWVSAIWTGDAAGLLDPSKEVDAAIKKINEGLSTRTHEAAGLSGMDYEQILSVIASEQQMAREKGVKHGEAKASAPRDEPMPPDVEESEDDGEEKPGGEK